MRRLLGTPRLLATTEYNRTWQLLCIYMPKYYNFSVIEKLQFEIIPYKKHTEKWIVKLDFYAV